MDKNVFLRYNEIVYQIHACKTEEKLFPTLLAQLKLFIPYTYASIIPIQKDPETGELKHGLPYSWPRHFQAVERAWVEQINETDTAWLSYALETIVLRDSDFLGDVPANSYRTQYIQHGISDCIQVNLVYEERILGRIVLYRAGKDWNFTDQDAFYLRALSNHIDLAYHTCLKNRSPSLLENRLGRLAKEYGLTRREEEIVGCIFQGMDNEDLVAHLRITKNTLLKHLQNIYRKCGVFSRVDLLQLYNQVNAAYFEKNFTP